MTKEEAQQFRASWQLANRFIKEEIRRTPASVKLQQLALMYEAGHRLGWGENLRAGEDEVRERWRQLKERLGV